MDVYRIVNCLIVMFFITIFAQDVFCEDRTIPLGLTLVKIEKFRNLPENSIYNQVMNYSKDPPFGDKHGRSTNVHETVHGINNYLRNKYAKKNQNYNLNGFYVGEGYGAILENPKLKLRQVRDYVPNSLRGYRFKLYFESQLIYWDNTPTYHIDEWSAYIAGAESAVDDYNNKIFDPEKPDSVSGSLEFAIYCTSLAMATKDLDNDYWQQQNQFKLLINYFLIKSEKVFFEGRDKFPSKKQDILLENLRQSPDTENMRNFLKTEFQGVFIN